MADIALLLGPVVFTDFEVPARITLGGGQRVAVHRLLGGTRVIDSLGRDDAEIRFSGIFSGKDATLRVRTLDQLRAAGAPLSITWDVFSYTVVITAFEAEYRSAWWIPFRITCTVLRDEAAEFISELFSLADSALSDVFQATSWAGGDFGLGAAQAALSATNAAVRGTSDYSEVLSSLSLARGSIAQSMQAAEPGLATTQFQSASSASTATASLVAAVASAQKVAALSTANGYIGRAIVNLANAST